MVPVVRRHRPAAVEAGALVVLGVALAMLAAWTGPRTGSVGEAQLIRILEGGSRMAWFVLLPVCLVRWGAAERSRRAGAPSDAPDHENWPACRLRILAAPVTALVAASAAANLVETFAVPSGWASTVLLLGCMGAVGLLGESLVRDALHRRAVEVAEAAPTAAGSATAHAMERTALEEGEDAAWRGRAAPGRFATCGLPAGVVARAEFFSLLELDLGQAQQRHQPFALLVVSSGTRVADDSSNLRGRLVEALAQVFGAAGRVGYLGNDLFGVALAGVSIQAVSEGVRDLRELLAPLPGSVLPRLEPTVGIAVSVERETLRQLYTKALADYQSSLSRLASDLRAG